MVKWSIGVRNYLYFHIIYMMITMRKTKSDEWGVKRNEWSRVWKRRNEGRKEEEY
jgi:hypothetical protein